jgi:hypothetical protein
MSHTHRPIEGGLDWSVRRQTSFISMVLPHFAQMLDTTERTIVLRCEAR